MTGEIVEFDIEKFNVVKTSEFKGYEIDFAVDDQTFVFILGNSSNPFTLGVKHQFKNKNNCKLCGKVIYPVPFGQQPCSYFNYNKQQYLLDYFSPFLP
jgi:hypothetical protein